MDTRKITINCLIAFITDNERFVAYSPHLRIVGYGRTSEEAMADFEVAIKQFMAFHYKNKTLEKKLVKLGWVIENSNTKAPNDFSVPTELLYNSKISNTMHKRYAVA
jgi:hypothetical protein